MGESRSGVSDAAWGKACASVPVRTAPDQPDRGAARRPRRNGLRRGLAVASISVALGTGAAACGSSSPSSAANSVGAPAGATASAAAAVRKAPTITEQAGTADVAVRVVSTESDRGSGPLGLALIGGFNFATNIGEANLAITGVPASAGATPNLHLVFAGSSLYLQTTGALASLGQGKPWVKLSPSSLSELFSGVVASAGLGSLVTDITGNPVSALAVLDTSALKAAKVGSATVGKIPATKFAVTVDPTTAASEASGAAKSFFSGLGKAPIALDVWLDGSGQLLELQALAPKAGAGSSASPATSGSASGRLTGVTVEFQDFGAPVSAAVPPPSEVGTPATGSVSPGSAG